MILAASDLPVAPTLTDLYVAVASPGASARAFQLAREARRAGLGAQLELAGRSLKGQLKHGDRLGARYVAILGDEPEASLREMESGDQRELPTAEVIPTILRGSRLV
jgi:histidyl-tRNA synthetase